MEELHDGPLSCGNKVDLWAGIIVAKASTPKITVTAALSDIITGDKKTA